MFEEQYTLQEIIGKGGYSKVFACIHKYSGEKRAVKIIEWNSSNHEWKNEVDIMRKLSHKNIVKLYEYFNEQDVNGKVFIIMEYCSGMTLRDYLNNYKPLSNRTGIKIVNEILNTMNYIHNCGIAHMDIKAENIIIDTLSMDIKVIDFGLSTFNIEKCEAFNGSLLYAAPELPKRSGSFNALKADIWALGVLIYLIFFRIYPWPITQQEATISAIVHGWYFTAVLENNKLIKKLITETLVIEPEGRCDVSTLLSHISSEIIPKCSRITYLLARRNAHSTILRPKFVKKCLLNNNAAIF